MSVEFVDPKLDGQKSEFPKTRMPTRCGGAKARREELRNPSWVTIPHSSDLGPPNSFGIRISRLRIFSRCGVAFLFSKAPQMLIGADEQMAKRDGRRAFTNLI